MSAGKAISFRNGALSPTPVAQPTRASEPCEGRMRSSCKASSHRDNMRKRSCSSDAPPEGHVHRRMSTAARVRMLIEKHETLKKNSHGCQCIPTIDPRCTRVIFYWDGATGVALIFTALVTPVEVSIFPYSMGSDTALFWINRVIDVLFSLDILLQFVLMTEATSSKDGKITWLTSRKEIAFHYLRGWFTIDLVSVLVSAFDLMQSEEFQQLQVLRVLRSLRLIKVLRLLRASRVFKRYQTKLSINYSVIALFKVGFLTVLVSHWMACSWVLQAYLADDLRVTWLGDDLYCQLKPNATGTDPSTDFLCAAPASIYAASLYWAITTITSIGYGDIAPSQGNAAEQVVASLLMLFASAVWAHVLGTFCGVIATFNPELNNFREMMDDLERFMRTEHLPKELRERLREYFFESKQLRAAWANRRLLSLMPPSLKTEVAWLTTAAILHKVWFLKGANKHFLVQLSTHLHPLIFVPGDETPPGYLYIVSRGVALYHGELLSQGRSWGDDLVLSSKDLLENATARAMTYLEVVFCTRNDLIWVAGHYPETHKHLRFCAIKLALLRGVPRIAQSMKNQVPERPLKNMTTVRKVLQHASEQKDADHKLPSLDGCGTVSSVEGDLNELKAELRRVQDKDFEQREASQSKIAAQHAQLLQMIRSMEQKIDRLVQRQPGSEGSKDAEPISSEAETPLVKSAITVTTDLEA